MAFEKNLNGDDLIAHISEILDKAEQFGKKRADQVGTEIGKALSDGIQEEMDDAKKDVKNSVGELMAEWQKLVRSINNNKLQMKPEKIKVVLDTAEALKDTERFGKEVRKQLSGIAATFNGVKIKGLDAVAKKFKTSSEELESIDWGFGKHHDTMIQQVTKQADAVKDVGDAAKATQAAVEELTKREKDLANILDKLKEIKDETNAFNDPSIQKTEEKVRKLIGALDEYQTKLDAMRRLRKGNERTMYDTAKSEIADLKRALGAVQAIEDQTPNIKPKIEKKEKEVEQEKSKKTTTQQPVVGAGDSAKSIQEQTMKIEQQASSMKKLGNAAEQTGKQISTVLNKAVQKYNEIMSSIDADSVIGGAGGVTIENIGGLKGMLQKTKRIYDMYYESGTTFSDQRNSTQQEKALWKSETAALRGFLTSYSKYVDDSAEAIYAKIQGKKKEFAKYKLPEYSASESQDDEKYLAFKKEELSIYEKQLVVATELFELQRKYNGAKSYTPNWNKELDKDDDEVRALDFTESAVDNYREMAKLAKTSLDRVVEEIETKKARLAKQTAQAQEQEAASTARNNNLEHYNQLVQECIQLTGELSDAVAKHARVQREMANILQSGNIIPQELKDAREQIEEVISGYFKKDFFEPTLSTDGILMWLQSAEAAAISIDRLVDSVEFKYKQMLAAQSELDNTSKINSETTAIQTNTQAVEENIKAKKKQNKIKVRDLTREEYDAAQEKFQQENDGAVEDLEEIVDIIRQASQFGTKFETQITTSCKRATTAVQRFFSAIDPNKYPAIASWKDSMLESVRNGYFDDKDMYNGMYTGQYSWGVETIDEDRYYVFLNLLDVAKDKEKEFYAYLNEEYKKRDEGLEKQNELTRRLIQTYKKLDELHVNEPSWNENNEVKSIKRRLEYYEQEKALLQDIQNLKEEFSTIPGRYVNTLDFNEVLRVHRSTLRLGDYGNGNLKDNARAIVLYQAELERAIKRLDKTTALNGQAQEQLKVEQQITAEKQKQIEQQAAANKEVTETKIPVTPVVELKAAQNAIEESTVGTPVEVPVTPVVGEISTTQVSNDIINQLTKGINIEQLLTKYGIPSNKFDIGIDLFKDLAGALYQEDGKAGGEKVNKAFAQLADFIEQNAERTVQVDKTLEEFYNYMSQVQIRIPENMEETFAAENPDNWKKIKKQFAIGGNYQNKKRLITTSKYASTPDVLLEELLANGFGYALGVDKDFNGSAQDSLRIILDAVQRAKDEAKLGKTQKIIGLDMGAQAAMYGDLSEAASVVEQNYLALNAAASAVNAGNDGVAVSAEKTGETLRNQARDAEDAAKAMESLQNQEQTDEKSVFPAEKVETEIDRIRKAIHSSEIGLDQIANTEGLQAAVATYVKSLDEIDDKKFKLISVDINEMAEGVDRVTLKFQSLEDENVKLAQTWAMDDGNLTLGRLRTTKTFKVADENPSEPSDNSIEKYAKALTSTFQQINEISSKIYSLELKDDGSGVWSPLISSLEMQKADLLNKVQHIAQQINTTFNDSFTQGDKIEFPFSTLMNSLNDDVGTSGTIENFFNDVRTQMVLTEQSIDKFISTLQNGQNKAEEFAITLAEKLSAASKAAKALSKLYQSGMVSSQNEQYKGGVDKLFAYNEYKSSLPQDVTAWSPEQISTIQKMASELSNYVSELDKAISKEAKYFESKKQYANIVNMKDYDAMASSIDNVSKSSSRAKEDLEEFVTKFTGGRGIITGFTTSIDGISKINFGVLEEGTNQFRTFSAEMGTFTDKVYTYETSMKNMTAGTEAAEKALAFMSQIMSRLNANGFTVDNNDYVKNLYEKMQSLRGALAKTGTSKDAGDQSNLQNMANDANRAIKALASLENAWLKMNEAADGENVLTGGKIDKTKDVYAQMVAQAEKMGETTQATAMSIDGFDKVTNKLTFTLEGADGQVKTFVMSMDKLSGVATAQVKSIDKVKTGWQEFASGIGGVGKQLLQYGLRMVEVYDIIRYLRQGFNEVLEIDTAMTELKKVTDETAVAYDNFAKSAYASSKKIGSTMKEFIQATADFARLGYSIDEASQLAEAANVYKNVGDGIDDVAQASESIISTMKAFNIEATDSMGIVDRFNEIKITCLHMW